MVLKGGPFGVKEKIALKGIDGHLEKPFIWRRCTWSRPWYLKTMRLATKQLKHPYPQRRRAWPTRRARSDGRRSGFRGTRWSTSCCSEPNEKPEKKEISEWNWKKINDSKSTYLSGDALEDVIDERVHDGHGLA